jgi:hypothetical protein
LLGDDLLRCLRALRRSVGWARNQQQPVAISGSDFISVYEQHAGMKSVQGHRRSVEIRLRVFGHDYEIKVVFPGGRNQFIKTAGAVPAQKRVNVNDTLIIDELAFRRGTPLQCKLPNAVLQAAETIPAVGKWNLRQNK